ncbi:MAG: complex I subunit 5 family protein [Elusimicrobia bacterium]|jgi:formate hydrogenlyase subunit 3/multisubunit Na+/H+ antiporter MnhD subunit|nr:complex I subunit 5 family protein [Elusimicrobiota bacterium]
MNLVTLIFTIPLILGIAAIFIPKFLFKYGSVFAGITSAALVWAGIQAFPYYRLEALGRTPLLEGGVLSLSLIVLTGIFGFLITLYSIGHMEEKSSFFWSLFCWMLSSSALVFVAADIIVLMVAWGVTGLILALMIWQDGNEAVGKKTFIIVGGSDAVLLFGMVAMAATAGTMQLGEIVIKPGAPLEWVIFGSLIIAAFTKAGAMPFHTWIPDTAKDAAVPVVAALPASIDKLLGIYLLKKIFIDWFVFTPGKSTLLMVIGAFTVIAAVFMALSQHNLRRLLGYHAVSQVGYMIMGIGTGTPIGIAGGLLHMVNNAIYKQGLFLGAGVIEKETGTSKLEDLGGLYKNFPVTFLSFTIMAMAISGIPPLNGFLSKWMIYQSIVKTSNSGGVMWVVYLTAAIFGSVLTLASFVKIIHAAFLGQPAKGRKTHGENISWQVPALVILPLACIVLGVFPEQTVYPLLEKVTGPIAISGIYKPMMAAALLIFGAGFALLAYVVFKVSGYRISEPYIGGEKITPAMRVSGVEFYTTIESIRPFKKIYNFARKGYFDIYELLKEFVFYWIKLLRWIHDGVITTYILWVIIGTVVLMFGFLK